MIKGQRKPLKEIEEILRPFRRVLTLGCGGCVSICLAGGQKEVFLLNDQLKRTFKNENRATKIDGYTIERQCSMTFLDELDEMAEDYDCLLSMACGAGVQYLAEKFPEKPVFPAINTMAIGIDRQIGVYEERCRACGECVLAYTGGICPVTRCAKGLFNGPCGGTSKGNCEVSSDIPCAWLEIYQRLSAQGRLEDIHKLQPPMEWQNQVQRTIINVNGK
ncbi:MAG: methylenetetrahydrofolate reductase C-terminal domain-containing protein [Desulfobacteraceae bacterium]